jgi:rhamnogalacturonan endolyase
MCTTKLKHCWAGSAVALFLLVAPAFAQRQMENLGRGVVAVHDAGKVFVSWRLLGTEPDTLAFDVLRSADGAAAVKLNGRPLREGTWFVDETADLSRPNTYTVRPLGRGPSGSFTLKANPPSGSYLTLPLQTPDGYTPNDASVGDLDGDGEYEIVLHQTGRSRDNSQAGQTDPPILQAYKLDGTLLWTINLGRNIREGAHYTQFMVYDLDGDGRAEIACKTADGTVDGTGKLIGDAEADYRNEAGYILRGPEFLTIFDGRTGAALATTNYIPPRHPTKLDPTPEELHEIWGDGYGNRCDRFLACVAYLDGRRPSLVMCRGYYTRSVLAAWDWRDGRLTQRWVFDSDDGTPGNRQYRGQGAHSLTAGDVDGDGRDEIVYGACAIDDNGKGLYSTRLGHGDALHMTDMDPERPGLEVWMVHETPRAYGANGLEFRDARSGKLIWGKSGEGADVGRGVAFDIDPRHRGYEMWASRGALYNARGEVISTNKPAAMNFGVWWDGDRLRELLDKNWIAKWDWKESKLVRLLTAEDCSSNNGTKATPTLSADILGDWREEVIWRTNDGKALRIYTTTVPTPHRCYTLMHDPQYRLAIAWQNVAYNQPPHPGFFFGEGMKKPPRPNIITGRRN